VPSPPPVTRSAQVWSKPPWRSAGVPHRGVTRNRRLLLGLQLLALPACYEHAPHRGPLAAATDSLVPPNSAVTCQRPAHGYQGDPSFRECQSHAASVFFSVTRDGRVLELTEAWPGDSAGQLRAAALRDDLARVGVSLPPADTSNPLFSRWHWKTDSVCATLFLSRDTTGFLYSRQVSRAQWPC